MFAGDLVVHDESLVDEMDFVVVELLCCRNSLTLLGTLCFEVEFLAGVLSEANQAFKELDPVEVAHDLDLGLLANHEHHAFQ